MTFQICCEGLGRRFPSARGHVDALVDVHLELSSGRLVAVRGPSGCGKSTLLNLLGLLDRPTAGRLQIDGVEVGAMADAAAAVLRREKVGFLFQDAGLIDRMSVLDNVLLPLGYRRLAGARRLQSARAAIQALGLAERTHARVDALSGGERQRVGLARVLALRPSLIICDEPTASLDEANSGLVVDHLLAAAVDGALVVCASHDPIVIERADTRLVMERGRLVAVEGAT
ncbi:ABC transporter ATP-binding protein [Caulobacter mirabilis]|uniref:ABC transporter ATP-binding protein n=1 Tax=Caulobacter mirabilis TaxID=69666 RepID=UPI001559F1E4|nr:ATP-binding cassette domain-containing protein [Caulobacter mirabilis]